MKSKLPTPPAVADDPFIIGVCSAALACGVTEDWARRWIQRGIAPHIKTLGGRALINRAGLELLRRHAERRNPPTRVSLHGTSSRR